MAFYNEPAFWTFLGTTFAGFFGVIKFYFVHQDRTNESRAKQNMSVERFKADNIKKSVDYLMDVQGRLEPLVLKHEAIVGELDKSTKMVGMIEQNLTSMFRELQSQYEGFESRVTKMTASYQLLVDRVDTLDKRFGSVILKK